MSLLKTNHISPKFIHTPLFYVHNFHPHGCTAQCIGEKLPNVTSIKIIESGTSWYGFMHLDELNRNIPGYPGFDKVERSYSLGGRVSSQYIEVFPSQLNYNKLNFISPSILFFI